jgi:hypothetical protein
MFLHYGEMEDTVIHCRHGEKELEGTVSAERWRRTFCFSCTEMKEMYRYRACSEMEGECIASIVK